MGGGKRHVAQAVDPELVQKIRREVSESIAELAGLSPEAALSLFDRSFLAKTVAARPYPVLHETADYWARLVLEKTGTELSTK